MAVAVDGAVGTGLGLKGSLQLAHLQAAMLQQVGQHGIGEQAQLTSPNLHGHVAIAKVIGGLEQGQGIGAAHLQQLLRSRPHLDQRFSNRGGQPLTRFQGCPRGSCSSTCLPQAVQRNPRSWVRSTAERASTKAGTAPGLAASPRSRSTKGRSAGSELAIAGCTMVSKQHAW